MKLINILAFLLGILLTGCTIVNLAPPQQDDAFLQRTLEKHFGPEREETKEIYSDKNELNNY